MKGKTNARVGLYQQKTITSANFTPVVIADSGYSALSKVVINGILIDPHYSYTTETDDDVSFTKLVPVGALPNGVINTLGGIITKVNDQLQYNEPKAVDVKGFNLWDEETEIGIYDIHTGDPLNEYTNRLRSKNMYKVLPNSTYYVKGDVRFIYLDANQQFLKVTEDTGYITNRVFTTPSNCHFVKLNLGVNYGITYNNDICINVSNTNLNGIYKPGGVHNNLFSEQIAAIKSHLVDLGYDEDVLGYGIDKDNCNYIDFENKKVVIKYTKGDLGTLDWSKQSHTSTTIPYRFYASLPIKLGGKSLCSKYQTSTSITSSTPNKTLCSSPLSQVIYILDTDYDNYTETEFKAAMSGVPFIYELATPIEIDISDLLESALIQPLEAGGVITLENDYDAAIPSSITYLLEE